MSDCRCTHCSHKRDNATFKTLAQKVAETLPGLTVDPYGEVLKSADGRTAFVHMRLEVRMPDEPERTQ